MSLPVEICCWLLRLILQEVIMKFEKVKSSLNKEKSKMHHENIPTGLSLGISSPKKPKGVSEMQDRIEKEDAHGKHPPIVL